MMTQFPGARQPALGIQDAAMLPAQAASQMIQRLAAAEAAYAPTTQTFDSTTSSTILNATAASSGGGSLRSLMMPLNGDKFVPIVPNPSPALYNGPLFSQFGDQQLTAAVLASQTGAGSMCGRAVLGACGINYYDSCGCASACTQTLGETTVIDEENSNGIIDESDDMVMTAQASAAKAAAAAEAAEASAKAAAAAAASAAATSAAATSVETVAVPEATPVAQTAPAASIQYVTYNA